MKYFVSILFLFTINAVAQNDKGFQEIEYITQDSVKISASFQYPNINVGSLPAIILIHQGGSSRKEWMDLPIIDALLKEGYAVLAYDVRLHGKSGSDGDFADLFNNANRSPLDLLATIDFLKKDKKIDSNRVGIIGASIGANLSCMSTASTDFNIKSAVSISAKTSAVQNLSGTKETIIPKNVFYIASKNEQSGKRAYWAEELYTITIGERKVEISPGDKHGSYILKEHQYLQDEIIQWFKKTL